MSKKGFHGELILPVLGVKMNRWYKSLKNSPDLLIGESSLSRAWSSSNKSLKNGSKWSKLGQNGPKKTQNEPNWFKMGKKV